MITVKLKQNKKYSDTHIPVAALSARSHSLSLLYYWSAFASFSRHALRKDNSRQSSKIHTFHYVK